MGFHTWASISWIHSTIMVRIIGNWVYIRIGTIYLDIPGWLDITDSKLSDHLLMTVDFQFSDSPVN